MAERAGQPLKYKFNLPSAERVYFARRSFFKRNAHPIARVDKAWPTERTSVIGIAAVPSRR